MANAFPAVSIPNQGSLAIAGGPATFDQYAGEYEASLRLGLGASGEGPEYFARRRVEWVAKLLRREAAPVERVLDFGCGIGLASSLLQSAFDAREVWGFDPSRAAIDRAKRENGENFARFCAEDSELPRAHFDLVYCNGVFHHISPGDRAAALGSIHRALRPDGWFAFWENNPWNPGTRYVMRRIPFDRDAVTLSPVEARRLLRAAGFRVRRTDAWFLFPRMLKLFRPLEALVHRLPLGAQYLVLAQKATTLGERELNR